LESVRLVLELLDEWAAEQLAVPDVGQTVNVLSPELGRLLSADSLSPKSTAAATTPITASEKVGIPPSIPPPRLTLSSRPSNVANLLILDPDRLVPATSLASSLSCPRRAVLRSLVREGISGPVVASAAVTGGDDEAEEPEKPVKQAGGGKALLYGNVLHQVAQTLVLGATTTTITADTSDDGAGDGDEDGGPFGQRAIARAVQAALGQPPSSSAPSDTSAADGVKPLTGVNDDPNADADRSDAIRADVWKADLDWAEVGAELADKAQAAFGPFGRRFLPSPRTTDGGSGQSRAEPPDNLLVGGEGGTERLTVVGLHAIEEDLRSPLWGLQGKVDLSLHVRLEQAAPAKTGSGARGAPTTATAVERAVPFEIKTGRTVGQTEHRAQTAVYCLLMEERYGPFDALVPHLCLWAPADALPSSVRVCDRTTGTPVPAGLLYYTQPNAIHKVAAEPRDIRALICRRNVLAGWLGRKGLIELPAPVGSQTTTTRDALVDAGTSGQTAKSAIVLEDLEVEEDDPYADAELELDLLACAPPSEGDGDKQQNEPVQRLPETIDRAYDCARCYQVDICMLYRKVSHLDELRPSASPEPLSLIPPSPLLSTCCAVRRAGRRRRLADR